MTIDRTGPNVEWTVIDEQNNVETWERAGIAVLMDIRRELRALNRLLACQNFMTFPSTLRAIEKNTMKPKRKSQPFGVTSV